MLVVFGVHRFKPKRVAYRNDFCLNCDQPRLAQRIRSFFVGHLYWIPLLPLGFWKEWRCVTCGVDPARRTRTGQTGLVVLLAVLTALVAAIFTVGAVSEWKNPDGPVFGWVSAALWGFAAALIFIHTRMKKTVPWKVARLHVVPSNPNACAFCGGALQITSGDPDPQHHCPVCGVDRLG